MKALIFDLDGTLIDSVYPHALAWQQAFRERDLCVPAWEIHRRIGISGKILARAVARERGTSLSDEAIAEAEDAHARFYRPYRELCVPLPGAENLLRFLRESKVAHGIATTGKREEVAESLRALGVGEGVVVMDGSSIEHTKPDPDLFVECQKALGVDRSDCLVIGDAVWDVHAARRAGILAVGVLSGGFGEQELYNAGAMRVYSDVAHLHRSIDELGVLT